MNKQQAREKRLDDLLAVLEQKNTNGDIRTDMKTDCKKGLKNIQWDFKKRKKYMT